MSQSGNYKGITLLEVAYKIFVKIVDSCLQLNAEKLMLNHGLVSALEEVAEMQYLLQS